MKFHETSIPGLKLIQPEPVHDERGFFSRIFDSELLQVQQSSISYNKLMGTLRGLHYQEAPYEEEKLVYCISGSVFDVVVDLQDKKWFGVKLSEENGLGLFIPKGCAHGFVTLQDDSKVFYAISERYQPQAAKGIRWDDPAIGIKWPITPTVISQKDREHLWL